METLAAAGRAERNNRRGRPLARGRRRQRRRVSARGGHTRTRVRSRSCAARAPPHLALPLRMRSDPGAGSFLCSGAPSASLPKARQVGSAAALSGAREAGACLQSPRLRGGAVATCVTSSGRPAAPSPAAAGARGRRPASAAGPRCREEARAGGPGRKGGRRLGGRERGSSRTSSPAPDFVFALSPNPLVPLSFLALALSPALARNSTSPLNTLGLPTSSLSPPFLLSFPSTPYFSCVALSAPLPGCRERSETGGL